jgi:hypothetical protein
MIRVICSILLLLSTYSEAHAVQIKNARSKIVDNSIILTYDLPGKPGERVATVKVALVVGGERYTTETLSLVGDYGSNISIGLNKKIVWNLLKDMPAGYQGEMSWEIDADADVYDPLNIQGKKKKIKQPIVTENTMSDPNSKLTWFLHPTKIRQTDSVEDANTIVAKLNKSNLAGYSDWRLPNKIEIESLSNLLKYYGYTEGQSMINSLGRLGFQVPANFKMWAVDKSSAERVGSTVYASSTAQVNANVNSKSTGTTSPGRSYTPSKSYTNNRSTSVSGSGVYDGSATVSKRAESSGLSDVYLDSSTGYFMKQLQNNMISIIPVRGDGTDIYAISVTDNVNIIP